MKDSIIVLHIHQDAQVDNEKKYTIENNIVTVDGESYTLQPYNIMFRKQHPYAILLDGIGFTTINKIGGI
jgi:hypothetical protein